MKLKQKMIRFWQKNRSIIKTIGSWAWTFVSLYILIEVLGPLYGVLGFIGYTLIATLVIYLRQRKQFNEMFLNLFRMIELHLFGRIQEREFNGREKATEDADRQVRDKDCVEDKQKEDNV